MKKMYLVFISAVISLSTMAQAGSLQWAKCFGGSGNDSARSVANTTDGGFYVAGVTYSNDGNVTGNHNPSGNFSDVWVIKVSATGSLVWQKAFGGTHTDQANSICATTDGGAVIAGWTNSNDGDVSGLHGAAGGAADFWVIKIDNSGSIQWQKTLGGSKNDYAQSIKQTRDGGYIVAGNTYSNDSDVAGNHDNTGATADAWIVKLNSSGTIQWQKNFGGTKQDDARCVIQTSDDDFVVVGDSYSTDGDVSRGSFIPATANPDYWALKVDSVGALVWEGCMGGTNGSEAYSVVQTSTGTYFMQGYTQANDYNVSGNFGGSSGTADNWLINMTGGNMNWQNTYGGTKNEFGRSIIILRNGHMVTTGASNSNNPGTVSGQHDASGNTFDLWTYEVKSSGYPPVSWQNAFGGTGNDGGYDLVETADSNVVEVGYTSSTDGNVTGNHGASDFWVVKVQTATGAQSTVGVDEVPAAEDFLAIYPNPAHGYTTICVNDNLVGTTLELTNAVGRTISRQQITSNRFQLQTVGLAKGIYLVRVAESMVKKLVVE